MLTQKRKNDEKVKRRPTPQLASLLPFVEKQKRKRNVPFDKNLEAMTGWQRITYLEKKSRGGQLIILMAMLWLAVMFCEVNEDLVEWHNWQLLEDHGETRLALLVATGSYERGASDTHYYAEYSYHHEVRRQDISAERYQELQGATEIEVIAVDDLVRLPGSKPDFSDRVVALVIGVSVSILLFAWGMREGYQANSVRHYRY